MEAPREPRPTKRRMVKRERRRSTNVFSSISQGRIQILREAFSIIDQDRDGAVSHEDLRRIFTSLGETISDAAIDEMLVQIPGTLNFTTFLGMFAHMTCSLDTEDVRNDLILTIWYFVLNHPYRFKIRVTLVAYTSSHVNLI